MMNEIAGDSSCIDCICIETEPCVWHMFPGEKLEVKPCPRNTSNTGMNWHHDNICCICEEFGEHVSWREQEKLRKDNNE